MGKKKMEDVLPTLGQSNVISEERAEIQISEIRPMSVSLSIPMVEHVEGFATRHVETKLTYNESMAFKAVLLALIAQRTKLKSGRIVKRPADVYRWLAEQIAAQYANHNRYGDRHANG